MLPDDIKQAEDVLVMDLLQQLDLTQGSAVDAVIRFLPRAEFDLKVNRLSSHFSQFGNEGFCRKKMTVERHKNIVQFLTT